MTCVSGPADRPPLDAVTPLRHDKDCPHCHGTSVGVYVVEGARTVVIPCPCGVVDDEPPYRPHEELRKRETPIVDRLKKKPQ